MSGERLVCVIQARQGSARLPGKSLRPLAGRPLIAHVVERAKAFAEHVVVATSRADRDTPLVDAVMGLHRNVPVVRGDETDVLDRMLTAARLASAAVIVRVTGDCPLWAPDVAFRTFLLYRQTGVEYCWNDTTCSGFPDGTDVEIFSREALEAAARHATSAEDREHVTPWMRRTLSTATLLAREDWSRFKLSVDREEDLVRVSRIVARLPPRAYALDDTLRALEAAEEVAS